jgi:DNA repair protein RadC
MHDRKYILSVRDIPNKEKPREKLLENGPSSLSMKELLAILLSNGSRKEGVLEMAHRLVSDYGEKSIFSERNVTKLAKESDLPIVKACQIVATGEIGRRLYERGDSILPVIQNAKDVYNYLRDMGSLTKEHVRVLYLGSHNRIVRDEVVSIGTVDQSLIHARDVFRPAIECNASAIVIAHNHPSGELEPSNADVVVTDTLIKAGKIVGVPIIDHIIISKKAYKSINAKYNSNERI